MIPTTGGGMHTRASDPNGEGEPRKVNNSTFVWAIGLISSMMVLGFGWSFAQVQAARQEVSAVRELSAKTDVKVDTYRDAGNNTSQAILLTIGRLQVDVEWIRRQIDADSVRRR